MNDVGERTRTVLEQYAEGLISAIEFRTRLREIAGQYDEPQSPPTEATRLKHEAKRLRKELAKAKRLNTLRARVVRLQDELLKRV